MQKVLKSIRQCFRRSRISLKRRFKPSEAFLSGLKRVFSPWKLALAVCIGLPIYFVLPEDGEIRIFTRGTLSELNANRAISETRASLDWAKRLATVYANFSRNILPTDDVQIVGEERIGSGRLEDFVSASLTVKAETDWIDAKVGFNLVQLIQSYIDNFFSDDAFNIIINSYNQPEDLNEGYYSISLNLHRREAAFASIDVHRSRDGMIGEAANFFLKSIFEKSMDCGTRICASDQPYNNDTLREIASAWDALAKGRDVGMCRGISSQSECSKEVRSEMERIESENGPTGLSDFTTLIAEVAALRAVIEGNLPSAQMTKALDQINQKFLQVSSRDDVFAKAMADDERLRLIMSARGLGSLELNSSFLGTYHHFRDARELVHRAKFAAAAAKYVKVIDAPKWFESILERFHLYASVEANFEDSSNILERLNRMYSKSELSESSDISFLALNYTIFLEKNKSNISNEEYNEILNKLNPLWASVTARMRDANDIIGANLEYARYLYFTDRSAMARDIIGKYEADLRSNYDHEGFATSLATAAYFASVRGDGDKALEFAERAIHHRPSNTCAFMNHDDFKFVRTEHQIAFSKMLAQSESASKASC